MTEHDTVSEAIQTYIDFLHGAAGAAPSLDHLSPDERAEVQAVIDNLEGGRHFDPSQSAPSLESLLYGSPFYEALSPEPTEQAHTADPSQTEADLHRIRDCLEELFPWEVAVEEGEPVPGITAPTFVVAVNGHRLRAQVRRELGGTTDLHDSTIVASAAAIYLLHPETSGVVLAYDDDDLSSIIIDPFDSQRAIEVPTGHLVSARPRRPVLPFPDAVRAYLDAAFPTFDPIDLPTAAAFDDIGLESVDLDGIVQQHIQEIQLSGHRARTEAKREAWSVLGAREADVLKELIIASYEHGLDRQSVDTWLEAAAQTST